MYKEFESTANKLLVENKKGSQHHSHFDKQVQPLEALIQTITQMEGLTDMQKELLLMNQQSEEERKKLAQMLQNPTQVKLEVQTQIEVIQAQKAERIA